jgi:hypothetical protein
MNFDKNGICEFCKKDYIKKQPHQKFCSRKCTNNNNNIKTKNKNNYIPKGKYSEISDCTVCGKIYTKNNAAQKTCSPKCSKQRTKLLHKGFNFNDNKNFERENKINHIRTGGIHPNYCVYCGDFNQCKDHVIPVSYNSVYRDYNRNETVDCCTECNTLAGSYPATSVEDKSTYLLQRYKTKYSKILNLPIWDNSELEQLKGNLKMQVKANENKRRLISKKMEHLRISAMGILPPNIQNVLKLYKVKSY